MVNSIRVEMTRNKLRQAIKSAEFFKNNFPNDYYNQDFEDYLSDLKSADAQLEITNIHAESNRSQLKLLANYFEDCDHDLKCRIIDNQTMEILINNYWNGIGDGFSFYLEKRPQDEYLILSDDGWLVAEKEMHTPGVKYDEELKRLVYSDIHKYGDEMVLLANNEIKDAILEVNIFKNFMIDSFSAYYDKVENKGE